jgi:hypothetical protein
MRTMIRNTVFAACVGIVAATANASGSVSVSPGLTGKLITGYQGWFGCPKDFQDNAVWQHWFVKGVQPQYFTVDFLPSLRDIDPKDLCDTGLPRSDNKGTIKLFSSQNPRVVEAHFRWMKENNVDGAALQRFVEVLSDTKKKARADNVAQNVRAAAEASSRAFFITYDVSGADPKTVVQDIRDDWQHITNQLKTTDSPSYLTQSGKPVLELWGFGFLGRPGEATEVTDLIGDLKNGRNGLKAATVIGGVPTSWRTLSGDSRSDAGWSKAYRSYDVISPWSVGRFVDEQGADAFLRDHVLPDIAETQKLGLQYMPVISPGFSWYNLMTNRGHPEQAVLNQTRRDCGRFMWHQISNLLGAHSTTLYAAMFDEVDEGTALFPTVTRSDHLPAGAKMVYLNEDGCALPDDWYLRIVGKATGYLRSHTLPPKYLDGVLKP